MTITPSSSPLLRGRTYLHIRQGLQGVLAVFPVGEVGGQVTLEQFTVVWCEEMDQLVDDDKFAKRPRQIDQVRV